MISYFTVLKVELIKLCEPCLKQTFSLLLSKRYAHKELNFVLIKNCTVDFHVWLILSFYRCGINNSDQGYY